MCSCWKGCIYLYITLQLTWITKTHLCIKSYHKNKKYIRCLHIVTKGTVHVAFNIQPWCTIPCWRFTIVSISPSIKLGIPYYHIRRISFKWLNWFVCLHFISEFGNFANNGFKVVCGFLNNQIMLYSFRLCIQAKKSMLKLKWKL